jgi:hypothetical protein
LGHGTPADEAGGAVLDRLDQCLNALEDGDDTRATELYTEADEKQTEFLSLVNIEIRPT